MKNRIAILTFLLGASVTFAQPQGAPPITFSSRAVPVTRLLKEYSLATGKKVRATSAMESDIVVVRLANVEHEEFRRRLAAAVAGRWTTEGEDQVLVPDEPARAMESRREIEKRALDIRAAIKVRLETRKRADGDKTWYAQMGQNWSFANGENLLTSFLQLSDTDALARLKRGERVVYSTVPNVMQRPLPNAIWPEVSKFVADHNRSVEAQKQQQEQSEAKTDVELKMEAYLRKLGVDPDGPSLRRIGQAPAKVLFAVQRSAMGVAGLSLSAALYDADGKVLAQASEIVGYGSGGPVPEVEIDPQTGEVKPPPEKPTDPNDPAIQLSAESRAVADFLRGWTSDDEQPTEPTSEILAKLARPDLHDPLSFADSEALLWLAERKRRNLVALLPDRVIDIRDKLPISALLALLKSEGMEVVEETDWMVVRSLTPSDDRAMRLSRSALARLIAAHDAKGYVSLDDLSAFALATPGDAEDPLAAGYLRRFVPGAGAAGFEGPPSFDHLRLYGSLSAAQRLALREGRQIPFGTLVGRARTCLHTLLFGAKVSLGAPGPSVDSDDPMAEMILGFRTMFGAAGGADFRSEPTEAMPRGLPSDGYLVADVQSEPVGLLGKEVADFGLAVAGGRELGMYLYMKSDPKLQALAGEMPDPGPMTLGERLRWHLRIVVAPETEASVRLSDSKPLAGGATFTLPNLPPSLRAVADRTIAWMKTNPIPFFDPEMYDFARRGGPPPKS